MPLALVAFEQDPYFRQTWEFALSPAFTYFYYPAIQGARRPSRYSSHDQILSLDLQVSFLPEFDLQIETEFANTRLLDWGTRSAGLDLRYLLLDDIQGDPVSLTLGLITRYVPTRALRDPSTPYHSQLNFEAGCALGKEIDHLSYWVVRFWGYLGAGIANRGAPWLNGELAFEANRENRHQFRLYSQGYVGFGGVEGVNIRAFNGYANIDHRSWDIGGRYLYTFSIWGSLSLDYAYRLMAHSYPERSNSFTVRYTLPFSLF